ncbi:MAG: flavodoxin [Planctomycetes bacterium]|nr:flavodoxin [Planctomycetota bacterium]
MRLGLFYGSTLGHTAGVACRLAARLGPAVARTASVAGLTAGDLEGYDALVLGTSTWYLGALQDDWERFLGQLERADLRGVPVAFFGTGDQDGFPVTFVDAMGRLRERVAGRGADVRFGVSDDRRYDFGASRALLPDGRFCGLALDEDNQSALTDERLDRWAAQLGRELRLPREPARPRSRTLRVVGRVVDAGAFVERAAVRALRGAPIAR